MEERTIDRPDLFPPGTEVHLYDHGAVLDPVDVKPAAVPLESIVIGGEEVEIPESEGEMETVVDDAVTAFTVKLPSKGTYYVGGEVDGEWRALRLTSGVLGSANSPPARFPTHSAH